MYGFFNTIHIYILINNNVILIPITLSNFMNPTLRRVLNAKWSVDSMVDPPVRLISPTFDDSSFYGKRKSEKRAESPSVHLLATHEEQQMRLKVEQHDVFKETSHLDSEPRRLF